MPLLLFLVRRTARQKNLEASELIAVENVKLISRSVEIKNGIGHYSLL